MLSGPALVLTHIDNMAVDVGLVVNRAIPRLLSKLLDARVHGQLTRFYKRLCQLGLFVAQVALLVSQQDFFVVTVVGQVVKTLIGALRMSVGQQDAFGTEQLIVFLRS